MRKSEILQIIREEIQVVLTNEEAIEVFDLDPAALLDEMMNEIDGKSSAPCEEILDVSRVSKD